MFTGIVEETGVIKGLSRKGRAYALRVSTARRISPIKEGDSLSINGTCLTLVGAKGNNLFFDIMEETFRHTSFTHLRHNDVVNIERALEWKSRIDGHFVLGHVDSVQKIKVIKRQSHPYIDVAIARDDRRYIVKKGSIAIDGISLTIGDIYEGKIRVYIIPYTFQNTNLKYKRAGDRVNIEFDILGKYVKNRPFI